MVTHSVALIKGVRKVMDIIFDFDPFTPTPASSSDAITNEDVNEMPTHETFVLRHDEFEFQNVLVDNDGNVTGIIDWDGYINVPRCIGYTSLSTFLRRDWLPEQTMVRLPHMSWDSIATAKYTRRQSMNPERLRMQSTRANRQSIKRCLRRCMKMPIVETLWERCYRRSLNLDAWV
ncbi:hypothetical protein EJ02DRAFT_464907 [Clathrospora elynae]|uniref:Aminoglycoside phosphotransferase domain-containing protein n=1 Tax=Clathrospora elynae TaxID=706981 RepID=A0A6A5STS3_9PLEO|nr:hypothetical protein EJ02DRAFT_464907 [Clathrospora elynae]